jgi:ribonuclease PH
LQQSIRPDSRAVDHLDPIELRTGVRADAHESLLNCE